MLGGVFSGTASLVEETFSSPRRQHFRGFTATALSPRDSPNKNTSLSPFLANLVGYIKETDLMLVLIGLQCLLISRFIKEWKAGFKLRVFSRQ